MGTKERRERAAQDTRKRILDAARDLFVKKGVEATTMRAIADRIEYTPTAIYHHFHDKNALIRELAAHDLRALAEAFERIGRIEDPIERLRRIGMAYIRFGLENPNHYRFLFMAPTAGKNHARERGPEEGAYGFLRKTVAEAIASGRLRPGLHDPDQVSVVCWATVHGIVSLTIAFEGSTWIDWPDPLKAGKIAVDSLVRGLLPPGSEA